MMQKETTSLAIDGMHQLTLYDDRVYRLEVLQEYSREKTVSPPTPSPYFCLHIISSIKIAADIYSAW